MGVTTSNLLFIPEVAKEAINGRLGKRNQFKDLMKFDNTLKGNAGDTVTVAKWGMIGSAKDVAEGASVDFEQMSQTTEKYTVKQAGKGITITRRALNAGGKEKVQNQAVAQLTKAMDLKIEEDFINAVGKAKLSHDASDNVISYAGVVNALDVFAEEDNTEKAIIVSPHQVTQLRLDPLFIDKSKYGNAVMVTGEIGMIANARVVKSRHIKAKAGKFENYVVIIDNEENQKEEEMPAVTAFIKTELDWDEQVEKGTMNHDITTMKDYIVAVTNDAKVLKVTFKEKEEKAK